MVRPGEIAVCPWWMVDFVHGETWCPWWMLDSCMARIRDAWWNGGLEGEEVGQRGPHSDVCAERKLLLGGWWMRA